MFQILLQLARVCLSEWHRQATIRRLNKLDDRTLADIGIHRGELPFLIARPGIDRRQTPVPKPCPDLTATLEACG
jgi:uncharacterized protein YjiS (DUF1127 family)